jgi:hypothetical protein
MGGDKLSLDFKGKESLSFKESANIVLSDIFNKQFQVTSNR